MSQQKQVTLHLLDHQGNPLTGRGKVELRRGRRAPLSLKHVARSNTWRLTVAAGTYELFVKVGRLVAPRQKITVGEEGFDGSVYLGATDWPFYRLGRTPIPFPPPTDLVAVTPRQGVKKSELTRATKKLVKEAGLKRLAIGREEDAATASSDIRLYRAKKPEVLNQMKVRDIKAVAEVARLGCPIDTRPGQTKIITAEFVVSFRKDMKASEAKQHIRKARADVVRKMVQAPNTWLIRFRSADMLANLAAIELRESPGRMVYSIIYSFLTPGPARGDQRRTDGTAAGQAREQRIQ